MIKRVILFHTKKGQKYIGLFVSMFGSLETIQMSANKFVNNVLYLFKALTISDENS